MTKVEHSVATWRKCKLVMLALCSAKEKILLLKKVDALLYVCIQQLASIPQACKCCGD